MSAALTGRSPIHGDLPVAAFPAGASPVLEPPATTPLARRAATGTTAAERHQSRPLRAVAVASLIAATLLAGCSGGGASVDDATDLGAGPANPAASSLSAGGDLPIGTSALPLPAGSYSSPFGFVPPLRLTVPTGWTSAHRGDDAFDVSQPDPARDAPLVAVAVVTPLGDAVAATLTALQALAGSSARAVTGTLLGRPATGFEVTGGSGELLRSPSGTLSLDLAPGQRVRVLGLDVDDVPLVVVVLVPDGARWAELLPRADALLAGLLPA